MKKAGFFLLTLVLCFPMQAQRKFDVSFSFDGKMRELILSVPTTPPPSDGYPVVMMMHGTSGDKNVFYNAKGWSELGEAENFITIFPSSLRWCYDDEGVIVRNTKFVNGDLLDKICPSDTMDLISDVRFFRRIFELLQDTLPINMDKVFCSGFSNGSVMSFKNAMEAGDLFKAAASTGAGLHPLDSTHPQDRIPTWMMIGTLDDRFIVQPFTEIPFGDDSSIYYFNKIINRTLACQGLVPHFIKDSTPLTKTFLFNTCLPGEICKPFLFTIIKGLHHQYPNGINHPVDAPRIFWQFFNNPPNVIIASTDDPRQDDLVVSCFPNPASDQIHIAIGNFEEKAEVSLYNNLGVRILQKTFLQDQFDLQKSETGAGIFHVQIQSGGRISTKRICFK